MISIGLLSTGEKAEVLEIRPKKTQLPSNKEADNLCLRVESMGLHVGQTVEMLSNTGNGPFLLKVNESRIALDRGLATKIIVALDEGVS